MSNAKEEAEKTAIQNLLNANDYILQESVDFFEAYNIVKETGLWKKYAGILKMKALFIVRKEKSPEEKIKKAEESHNQFFYNLVLSEEDVAEYLKSNYPRFSVDKATMERDALMCL